MKSIRNSAVLFIMLLFLNASGRAQTHQDTASERTSVSITVYNENLSLIREERTINFEKGTGSVVVPDIPSTIDGTSLHFLSLTDPQGVKVLEQNYEYDLVSQAKLLQKYVGKEVEFVRLNEETKQEYTVKGELISSGWGRESGLVAEINGKIELNPAGHMVLPSLPEGLVLKPQLEWLVSSDNSGDQKTEISYLAGGFMWSADYVALIDTSNTRLDLTGWVTLTNNSGTSFHDAGLKLVAGDVNVVRPQFNRAMKSTMQLQMGAVEEQQFKQTDLFEYKLYTLQRHTDLDNDETKQVELVSGKNVAAQKLLVYDGVADQWRNWYGSYDYASKQSFGQQSNNKVGVYIVFRNDEKSGLGLPLPKGKIRVYQRDEDQKEQFIGEDQIDHTPKDEEIKLYLGNAFDVVGGRAQINFKSYADGKLIEETIQIKIRNHKKEPVDLLIYEHPWRGSNWEFVEGGEGWTKVDQTTIKYPVKLAKDEEKVVTYTIRYSW
jgi:hypothetical protein